MTKRSTFLYTDVGRLVDPFNLTLADLTVSCMGRALSRINRFSGNGRELETISVAQHSVILSYLVPPHLRKAALMHDVCEMFIGDVPTPIKRLCPQLQEIEDAIIFRISELFKIPLLHFVEIAEYDSAIAQDEARFLFPDANVDPAKGLGLDVSTMGAEAAASAWILRFLELWELSDAA